MCLHYLSSLLSLGGIHSKKNTFNKHHHCPQKKKQKEEEETTKQREIFLEKVEKMVFSLHSQSLGSSFVISYKKRN